MNKRVNRWKRVTAWLLVGVIVAGTVYIAWRPRPILVDHAVIKRGPLAVVVEDDGVTRIRERYVISAPLAGRLLRIPFNVGDEVRANETVLARLEPTDPTLLDPRELAQAHARIRASERRLESTKAELAKAEAELKFAESEMGRARELKLKNAASDLEFKEKELAYHQAFESTRAATFAVDIAEHELELQRAALILSKPRESAENDEDSAGDPPPREELEIRAAIDGRILRIYEESTTVVAAGTPLLEVGDPGDLEIVVDVLSREAVRIRPGNPVRLHQWGGDEALRGTVRLVEPSGFTKVSALGVEEQRVNVIVDFVDQPESRVMLGDNFRVDCEIIVWQALDSLKVPTSALFRLNDQWHTFVMSKGIASRRQVEIGRSNGFEAEVLDGMKEGDVVIIYPSDRIRDGVRVSSRD